MNEQMKGFRVPFIGGVVQYVNLGDKDGKYPPEVQAAVVTGVYKRDPSFNGFASAGAGNNDPARLGVVPANKVGDTADTAFADLKVLYRDGEFNMKCVGIADELGMRGRWTYVD
jgi:hypothetical protein